MAASSAPTFGREPAIKGNFARPAVRGRRANSAGRPLSLWPLWRFLLGPQLGLLRGHFCADEEVSLLGVCWPLISRNKWPPRARLLGRARAAIRCLHEDPAHCCAPARPSVRASVRLLGSRAFARTRSSLVHLRGGGAKSLPPGCTGCCLAGRPAGAQSWPRAERETARQLESRVSHCFGWRRWWAWPWGEFARKPLECHSKEPNELSFPKLRRRRRNLQLSGSK